MSDLSESYMKRRSYQSLANTGGAEEVARNDPSLETSMREEKGSVSKVGVDAENGLAVPIESIPVVDINGPGVYDRAGAEEKATRTGLTNPREENGFWAADHAESGKKVLGRVAVEEEPGIFDGVLNALGRMPITQLPRYDRTDALQAMERSGATGLRKVDGYWVADHPEIGTTRIGMVSDGSAVGEFLGDAEQVLNAPIAGALRGFLNLGANVLGATRAISQEDADDFTRGMEQLNDLAVEDNPAAAIAGTVGEVTGQFIIPAAGVYSKLIAFGVSPLAASVISEAGVGLLGMSPNDENIFNSISEDSPAGAALRDLMAINPNQSEWANRSHNAVEALILLGMGEMAARALIKRLENARKIEKSPVVEKTFDAVDEASARLKADDAAGITRSRNAGDTAEKLGPVTTIAERLRGKSTVSALIGDEIPGLVEGDIKASKKAVADWYKTNLQGKPIETEIGPVRFSGKGKKKFVSTHGDLTTLAALPAVPDILSNGQVVSTFPLSKVRKDSIVKFHRFEGRINIAGTDYDAAVMVGEDLEGNLFYNLYKEKTPIHSDYHADPRGSHDVSATVDNISDSDGDINLTLIVASASILADDDVDTFGLGTAGDTDEILALAKPIVDRLRGNNPVSALSGDEIPGTVEGDDKAARAAVRSWYRENLQGKIIETEVGPVRFFGKGPGKTTSTPLQIEALQLVPAVKDVLEKGKLVASTSLNKAHNDGMVRFHRFEAPVQVGDKVYNTAVTVGEDADGNLSYNLYKENAPSRDDKTTSVGGAGVERPSGSNGDSTTVDSGLPLANPSSDNSTPSIEEGTSENIVGDDGDVNISATIITGTAPLALDVSVEEGQDSEEVQVASAASKFIRQMMDLRELRHGGKAATAADDAAQSPYSTFKDGVEGTDFNFDSMNTSEDVAAQISTVSKRYAENISTATSVTSVTKGEIPREVTKDLALLLGTDTDTAAAAVRALAGDAGDVHVRALAMRNMLVASGQKMDDLGRTVRDGGPDISDADYLKFREHLVRHTQLQSQMKGGQTESDQALSAFTVPADGLRASQTPEERLGALGGRSTAREIADKWLKTPVDRRARFADKSMIAKTRSVVFETWINGLLSGAGTHQTRQVNTVGNAVAAWQIPERAIAATTGAISGAVTRSPDRVRAQEIMSMFRGSGEGVVDGIRLAWMPWEAEMPPDGLAKIETQQLKAMTPENIGLDPNSVWGKGIDFIGQGIRLPGRALMSEDEFFKSVGYRMELRAQTLRNLLNARDSGSIVDHIVDISATGPSAKDALRLTELREIAETRNLSRDEFGELHDISLNNPTDAVSSEATDYSHIVTFTNELGEFGQSLQKLVRSDPSGSMRVIFPLIRTPANIVKAFGRRGPAALMMPSVYANFAAGGVRRDLALARIGMGTAVMSWAASLAMEGHITGGGPKDKELYSVWAQSNQAYSIKIGDSWYPYGRIDPIATLFGSVADAHDFVRYSDDEDANEAIFLAAAADVIKNIGSKNFLQGIADVSGAYHDPERYGSPYIANLVGTAEPFSGLMEGVNRIFDPIMREAGAIESPTSAMFQRILNEHQARYPGFGAQDLPPKRTFWGEEKHAYDGSWPQAFNAFSPGQEKKGRIKKGPIDQELIRLNQPLTMPSRRIGVTELSFEQYDALLVLMNKTGTGLNSDALSDKYGDMSMRQAMNNVVRSGFWTLISSDEAKVAYLKSIRNDFVDAARQALAQQDESLAGALIEEQADKNPLDSESGILNLLGATQSRIEAPRLGAR